MFLRETGNEEPEEQAEDDQSEQLAFHRCLEKICGYHAMKDLKYARPSPVRLLQGTLDLGGMSVGLIVEHLRTDLFRDLPGFDKVNAKQTGNDGEQTG